MTPTMQTTSDSDALMRSRLDQLAPEFSRALAKEMDTDRFIRAAMTAFRTGDERFRSSDPISILSSCMQAAQLGLSVDPRLGEFWLIPRWNSKKRCQWVEGQLGYKGLVKLARRNPRLLSVKSEIVRDGDEFSFQNGTSPYIHHVPNVDDEAQGALRCTYAVAYFTGGGSIGHVSRLSDIRKARDASESYKRGYGPWHNHADSMAMLVPLRALMKLESIDGGAAAEQMAIESVQRDSEPQAEHAEKISAVIETRGMVASHVEPEATVAIRASASDAAVPPDILADARAAFKSLSERAYSSNDEIFQVACGHDRQPDAPSAIDLLAIVQLDRLMSVRGDAMPSTHAEMLEISASSNDITLRPFMERGKPTEYGLGALEAMRGSAESGAK